VKIDDPFIIVASGATPFQLQSLHEIIKQNSNGWWHNFADVWIANGKNASTWISLLMPPIEGTAAKVLVLALPKMLNQRGFGGYLTDDESKWITSEYTETESDENGEDEYAGEPGYYQPEPEYYEDDESDYDSNDGIG